MHFDRPDGSFEFIVYCSLMIVHVNDSVTGAWSLVTKPRLVPSFYESIRHFVRNRRSETLFRATSIRLNKAAVAKCGIPGIKCISIFFLIYHQDAVNSNKKSVKFDDGHSVSSFR